jgi:predicted nucleic acid-binding protein
MHLLDTEVVWALRSAKHGEGDKAVSAWATAQPQTGLFVSALTLTELGAIASQIERTDKASAAAVRRWIDGPVTAAFEGHVLAIDAAVARRAVKLGYPHLRDGLFAATALEHGLTIATRTPAAFRAGKIRTFDPWSFSPEGGRSEGDWRQASRTGPVWLKNLFVRG